jgi:hypothetical protein
MGPNSTAGTTADSAKYIAAISAERTIRFAEKLFLKIDTSVFLLDLKGKPQENKIFRKRIALVGLNAPPLRPYGFGKHGWVADTIAHMIYPIYMFGKRKTPFSQKFFSNVSCGIKYRIKKERHRRRTRRAAFCPP